MKNTVLVLGGSGMLGAMVVDYLAPQADLSVAATVRTIQEQEQKRALYPDVEWRLLDAAQISSGSAAVLTGYRWIINAIGITKPLIRDDNPVEIEQAIRVNSLFPQWLAGAAEKNGQGVLQIATDCVYSGAKGGYAEADSHDPLDVYGKTKSLGEAYHASVHHLRCSIIGPEPKDHKFLVDWILKQAPAAKLSGFRNHVWNGVTTLQFARLCHGVIRNNISLGHLQHVVPTHEVTKCRLLELIAGEFGRRDLVIQPTDAKTVVLRTLRTTDTAKNLELWSAAGYASPPTVDQMVTEMARWTPRFSCRQAA